ncbi:MAG: FGGY family carbohydrate kinase, partial [Dongiaceae bacterium]
MTATLAIDQGTTGTKAHRLRGDGTFETLAGFEHCQIYPQQGWVEHDPEELARHVEAALERGEDAAAIGIANQGETVIAWDGETKRPIHNAIVWQDSRTSDVTERLKADGAEELTLGIAGLPLDPYFSAAKLRWLLDNVPIAQELRRAGRLRLGTSDSFLLDRLTGRFATDVTTASRTSLMNLETLQWDSRLADLFGVPIECLPEICPTAGPFAEARGIPVTASLVDQQAALFGHGCRHRGDAKITFGTGAFALAVGSETVSRDPESGLEATIAWKLGDAPCTYALQGGIYNAASAVNWARALGLFGDYGEIDDFVGDSAIARGLVFVPALSGLSCPYWDRRAAGLWLGMGLETTKADMMRALLEGVALLAEKV